MDRIFKKVTKIKINKKNINKDELILIVDYEFLV